MPGLAMRLRPSPDVERFARLVIALFLAQMGAGLLNLGLQAPIWMQLVHLLLADLLWISLVLLAAAALADGVPVASWPHDGRARQTGSERGARAAPVEPRGPRPAVGRIIWR